MTLHHKSKRIEDIIRMLFEKGFINKIVVVEFTLYVPYQTCIETRIQLHIQNKSIQMEMLLPSHLNDMGEKV